MSVTQLFRDVAFQRYSFSVIPTCPVPEKLHLRVWAQLSCAAAFLGSGRGVEQWRGGISGSVS